MLEPDINHRSVIQTVELDLCQFDTESRLHLDRKFIEFLTILPQRERECFDYVIDKKIVYQTEVLVPRRPNPDRTNLLFLLGNPATHSVSMGMFFSYEKTRFENKWREHRFWKSLQKAGILTFCKPLPTPTPENIQVGEQREKNRAAGRRLR